MIDERRKNESEYLYEDELFGDQLGIAKQIRISPAEGDVSELYWPNTFRSYLKQALLYLPGTFMLLHYGMGITYNLFLADQILPSPFILLMIIISSLMCVFGLGNPKNLKSLLVPAAVFAVGSIMGIANVVTQILTGKFWFALDDGWSLLFLPFALMAGVLVKSWADSNESDEPHTRSSG